MSEHNKTTETNKTTRTMEEIGISNYYDGLIDSIVSNWIEDGSETDVEELRQCADAMVYLIHCYNLKDLINNLFDVIDIMVEYDEEIGLVEG